jgi:prephenate dehydratase
MPDSIAYLGPTGTNAESAAIACAQWLSQTRGVTLPLLPYPSIAQAIQAVAKQEVPFAVVPVENSTEGSVRMTLDTVWQFDALQIQQALVLPISHALLSCASGLEAIEIVYSHPQAIAQCQGWLEKFLPTAQLIPTNSTTEALQHLDDTPHSGAISSQRAAQLYNLPIVAHPINDVPDNCTRFWVISLEPAQTGKHTSLAFSLPANMPGSLVKPLEVLSKRSINLSRIESRPTKRAVGDYLFFIDLEADLQSEAVQSALPELRDCTETLKIFGSYNIQNVIGGQLKPE